MISNSQTRGRIGFLGTDLKGTSQEKKVFCEQEKASHPKPRCGPLLQP
jgi:hypothetical protein